MKWRDWTGATLDFSKPERVAILVLLGLTVIIYLLPRFFEASTPAPVTDTAWMAGIRQLEIQEALAEKKEREEKQPYRYPAFNKPGSNGTTKAELFYFDPNTLATDGWRRLGLREKTIQTIERFREKGGRFREAEDLQKIYGLFPDEYERLVPFIRIESVSTATSEKIPTEEKPRARPVPHSRFTVIDINLADTSAWISLPGIGTKLAARIVNFREKLGGFYAISQVAETFGLADSVYQKIKPWLKMEVTTLKKININTASLDELKTHPYIRWKIASLILSYREVHGPFQTIESIRNIMAIDEPLFEKIKPYLVI